MAQFVGGRYQLIAQLGGGGMADVYLAKLTGKADFAKLAVVKRLKPLEDDDPEIVRMFGDEARLCARLNHPNIVQTFEVGEDTTGPFLVMEYIEGQPLGRIRSRAIRREKPLPLNIALKILSDTIDALAYAHTLIDHDGADLRVIHRDVSPENIMVTYTGNTKLVDFGVAKTSASASVTRAGVLKGKVAYMAPEQARSDTNIDCRADVFAAGLILWELCTRRRLWEGLSEARVFERVLDKDPLPRVRSVDPSLPQDLDDVCAKAIAKEKEDRFESAGAFLEALEKACAKNNLTTSHREIGQFVAGLFEVERDKVKALVSGTITKRESKDELSTSNIPGKVSILPQVPRTASLDPKPGEATPPPPPVEESDPLVWRALSSGSLSSPSLPSTSEGSSMPAETPAGTAETLLHVGRDESSKKNSPMKAVLTVAAVLGVVGIAVLVGTQLGGNRLRPDTPTPTNTTPVAATNPPPPPPPPPASSPAPEVPVEVSIDIAVKPTNAKLFVDGKATPSNPYRIKVTRSDVSHEIRAEADGYESRSMVVSFDRDRALDMALVKSTTQSPPPVVVYPPRTSTPPAHPPTTTTTTAHPPSTAAAPTTPPSSPKGISEIDPAKAGTKHNDKIDTDVFKR